MQFIGSHFTKSKVLDFDPGYDVDDIPPSPSLRNVIGTKAVLGKLRSAGSKLLFFARNIKGLTAESKDYVEFLEEGLDRQPDLAWTGTTVVDTKEVHHENHTYQVETITTGGATLDSLPKVANRLSLRDKFDDRTYEAVCQLEHVSIEDAVRCKNGTMLKVEKIHEVQEEEKRRANLKIHYNIDHAPSTQPIVPKGKTLLEVPPKTDWHHRSNELYIHETQTEDMPELTPEWIHTKEIVETSASFTDIKWTHRKAHKLPPSEKPKSTIHITHARYGEYGLFNFNVKRDIYVSVNATLKNMLLTSTGSNAMDTPIPAFLPRWDRRDNYVIAMGAAGRIGREPVPRDQIDRATMEPYLNQAVYLIIQLLEEKGMRPTHLTPEMSWRWLASTGFPNVKKIAYMQAFKKVIRGESFIPASDFDNTHKAFPKNECYLEATKPQRMILAGSLEMAAVLGPMCAILGNHFFSSQYTSKKIPETERPRLALERFGDGEVILNDMSAFEGSIDTWMKDHVEHTIMRYFFPDCTPWIDRCNEKLRIQCQDVFCKANSIRCSGDPQTSLGNSFTNLAAIFAAYMYATEDDQMTLDECKQNVIAWVEGDDSLVRINERLQDDAIFEKYKQAFIKLGFATKMERADFVGNAGYCSMFFNKNLNLCPRVAQTFLDFPWDHSSKINRGVELLALKAMSLHHTSPGQPLTWALCRHYSPTKTLISRMPYNSYEFEELQREGYNPQINGEFIEITIPAQVFGIEPSQQDRELFEEKYNIPIQKQIKLEKRILKFGVLGLIRKFKQAGNNWHWLELLCEVDGINLHDAQVYYKDQASLSNSENIPDDKIKYKLRRGNDGKICMVEVESQTHSESSVTQESVAEMPIDPLTYRKIKYERKQSQLAIARACRNYKHCRTIGNLRPIIKIGAFMALTPPILYTGKRVLNLACAILPKCNMITKEIIKLPGRTASLLLRFKTFSSRLSGTRKLSIPSLHYN